ncbi:Hypothetical predicted protein [Mytilus galloprovincialis]|uniref:Antistasin-like domain-containing protein n=1 Tax=Mytilus galloprovincialis TaxID=29158 RepID=A0A8B6DNE0_MYTGA|nr:Hypothetical predicted protein [Mytilus galloprovincialis]
MPSNCKDPKCDFKCEYGFKQGYDGCDKCECDQSPYCPVKPCYLFCEGGFQIGADGCDRCKCKNKPSHCKDPKCGIKCEYGFKTGYDGCEKCECEQPQDSEVGFVLTADSESSLAEDSDANADISDEVTSLSGDAQVDETEPTGSASEDAESISSEDTTIDDDEVHQDTEEIPPIDIRRSGRERRPPAWFRSGQFETSMAVAGRTSIPEWRQKADYISSLAQTPLFKATGLERDAARTILDIVKPPLVGNDGTSFTAGGSVW